MEVGTAETIKNPKKKKRTSKPNLQGGRSRGGDGNGGSSGGGGNGGGDNPDNQRIDDHERSTPEKSRILMWFLLVVVLMTFGGLISAYVVLATNNALEWQPFTLPVQVWISTVIILASSVTYHIAKKALHRDEYASAKKWFVATTVLGAAFISSQLLAWMELVNRGLYMKGNPYAGFFYILTAVHAIHVLGGIIALGYVLLRNWKGSPHESQKRKRRAEAQAIGWYWHTMDGLWLVLLFLLGFWK